MFFMTRLAQAERRTPDEADFKRIAALGMLFHCAENLYNRMGYQGFRAQVVTYAMARLSHEFRCYLDVIAIWKEQAIPELLVNALKVIIPGVRDVIVNPPSSQRNVTEWCKKDDCWSAVMKREIEVEVGTLPADENDAFIGPH